MNCFICGKPTKYGNSVHEKCKTEPMGKKDLREIARRRGDVSAVGELISSILSSPIAQFRVYGVVGKK